MPSPIQHVRMHVDSARLVGIDSSYSNSVSYLTAQTVCFEMLPLLQYSCLIPWNDDMAPDNPNHVTAKVLAPIEV